MAKIPVASQIAVRKSSKSFKELVFLLEDVSPVRARIHHKISD